MTIRYGGQHVDGRFLYELTGGNVALDLVNTLDERRTGPIERITDFEKLVDWADQAGVLLSTDKNKFLKTTTTQVRKRVVKEILELREALFEIVVSLVQNEDPNSPHMTLLNRWFERAAKYKRLDFGGGRMVWLWHARHPEVITCRVADAAANLFTDSDVSNRLRVCCGPTCAWTFLDYSRRRNRRWCDMSVCGNRTKVRRYYARKRGILQT